MKQTLLFLAALTITMSASPVRAGDTIDGWEVIHTANFTGENDHEVSGGIQIVRKRDTQYLVLEKDFKFDGAPDPRLGFSQGNSIVEESVFSGLNKDEGKQIYRLPLGFNATDYDEVTIWCDDVGVPLAEAKY